MEDDKVYVKTELSDCVCGAGKPKLHGLLNLGLYDFRCSDSHCWSQTGYKCEAYDAAIEWNQLQEYRRAAKHDK